MANVPLEPVEYPKVVIDGLPYSLKFGPGAQLRLERFGYPTDKWKQLFTYQQKEEGGEQAVGIALPLTFVFTLLSCCAGNLDYRGRWKSIELSPEQIADLDPTPVEIGAYSAAIGKMWSKAKPEGAQPAAVPASQPEPVQ